MDLSLWMYGDLLKKIFTSMRNLSRNILRLDCSPQMITLIASDRNRNCMAVLYLEAADFHRYVCPANLTLWVNLRELSKMLKLHHTNGIMNMYVRRNTDLLRLEFLKPDKF